MEKKVKGFTTGVFDMFHVGHLNLLKNAKDKCDYLIAGVNTDDLVKSYKSKAAIVPLDERMQIVNAIKFVDEVIPIDTLDKIELWEKIQYDILFIGDDWKGTERWIKTEEELKKFGVEVVYLPYTKGVTSSILRDKIIEF